MTSIPLRPVRKVVGNHRSLTGLYKSRKMQRVVPYESALERDLFMHLEWDLAVESYHAQPLRILYRHDDFKRAHVPDAPRGAVKTDRPGAVENRPVVGGHFQNRPVGLPSA